MPENQAKSDRRALQRRRADVLAGLEVQPGPLGRNERTRTPAGPAVGLGGRDPGLGREERDAERRKPGRRVVEERLVIQRI